MVKKIKNTLTKFIAIIAILILLLPLTNLVSVNAGSGPYYYGGVNYSAVFDPDYYYQNNPDVAFAYGNNPSSLLWHFVNCGMREGRQGSSNFNVYYYRSNYGDLYRAFSNDLPLYFTHYIYFGQYEGRIASSNSSDPYASTVYYGRDYRLVFDPLYYYNNYGDLERAFGYDPQALLSHFVNHGMSEGRQGSSNFSLNYYMSKYSDLRSAFGNNYYSYFIHYINNGFYEGRVASTESSYNYNGVNYSLIFNPEYYYNKYPDLQNAFGYNPSSLLWHFVNCGMNEGRQGSSNFNVYYYKNNYADLRSAFGNNLPQYYNHYMFHGYSEGRLASINSWSTLNGKKCYYSDGSLVTGWNTIDGRIYCFDNNGYLTSYSGIDVSANQGYINWEEAKNDGIDFAIIRIGYGNDETAQDDTMASRNMSECDRLGIPYGVYIYSYALSYAEVDSEVQHTLRMIQGHNPIMGIYFDMEDADGYKARHGVSLETNFELYTNCCHRYVMAIKSAGYSKVGIYASYNTFKNQIDYSTLKNYDNIWLAHWGINSPSLDCSIWQYTNNGHVSGISGNVDMDIIF